MWIWKWVYREVGKMERGGDSEELDGQNQNNFTCIFYTVNPLCTDFSF